MLEILKSKISLEMDRKQLNCIISKLRKAASEEKIAKFKKSFNECNDYKPFYQFAEEFSFLEEFVAPFYCEFCKNILKTPCTYDTFQIHISKHTGKRPFECCICKKGFADKSILTTHLRVHVKDFQYECKLCDFKSAHSNVMRNHKTSHTGEKPYFCETCGKAYRFYGSFVEHQKRHKGLKDYHCTMCPKRFFNAVHLRDHMKANHLNIKDKICDICQKAFSNQKLLRQHKQIHSTEKKFSCKLCGKKFLQQTTVYCHMRKVHEGINKKNKDLKLLKDSTDEGIK